MNMLKYGYLFFVVIVACSVGTLFGMQSTPADRMRSAIQYGNLALVKKLVKKHHKNPQELCWDENVNPLSYAVKNDAGEIVLYLSQETVFGTSSWINKGKESPFFCLKHVHDSTHVIAIAKALLLSGSDINFKGDTDKGSLLWQLAFAGHENIELIDLVVRSGIDIGLTCNNEHDDYDCNGGGCTSLIRAIKSNCFEMVNYLKNTPVKTPLQRFCSETDKEICDILHTRVVFFEDIEEAGQMLKHMLRQKKYASRSMQDLEREAVDKLVKSEHCERLKHLLSLFTCEIPLGKIVAIIKRVHGIEQKSLDDIRFFSDYQQKRTLKYISGTERFSDALIFCDVQDKKRTAEKALVGIYKKQKI